jgi:hypothetical protein
MKEFNRDNLNQLQQSIQVIIHSIEREKINIRINQERYTKKLREYNNLMGKPSLSKEQKLNIRKEKMEQLKKREIFSPNYGKKMHLFNPEEEIKTLKKSASMNEMKLVSIKDGINRQSLENNRLLREIDIIRRDRLIQKDKLERIDIENGDIDQQIKTLQKKNKRSTSKLNYEGLQNQKNINKTLEEKFRLKRDNLELKYHQVIQENIRKERQKIDELGKQRMANAVFADSVRKNARKGQDPMTIVDQDEIQDRIPILDAILEKWNYIIKFKKQMINKYLINSTKIKDTLDKLLLVSGLEHYQELPQLYEMDETQNAKIEQALSNISNEVDLLKEQKELMEKKIKKLQENKKETINQNEINVKEKEENINNLKKLNEDLLIQIKQKKVLFSDLQECTFNFLKKMGNTYLSDFVVKKINIEENSKMNENNVLDYLGSVYCYIQLISDFNDNVLMKKEIKQNMNTTSLVNKSIENLDKEIKFKLLKFNYKNCLNKVKKDKKQNNMFDDVIRRLANEIVKDVNDNYDINEDTIVGTNVSSPTKNTKKQNLRYEDI